MKKHLALILLSIIIFSSCGSIFINEEDIPVLQVQQENYTLNIHRVKIKRDKDGRRQCDKYVTMAFKPNRYFLYGQDFNSLLEHLTGKINQCIEIKASGPDAYFVVDLYYNEKVNISPTQLILQHLTEIYHLRIDTSYKELAVYDIGIADRKKLEKNKSTRNNRESGGMTYKNKTFHFSGMNLKLLTAFLNNHFSDYIFSTNIESDQRYDFELDGKIGIDQIEETMNEQYGLKLTKRLEKRQHISIMQNTEVVQ